MTAIRELRAVLIERASGRGELADLLVAWFQVVTGRVQVGD